MQLELSLDFVRFSEETREIQTDLKKYLNVVELRYFGYRSADSSSIIKLIGEALEWAPIAVAATVYLSTIAKHAADATWDKARSMIQHNKVGPLAQIANTLSIAATKVNPNAQIVVGISFPDDNIAVELTINSGTTEEIILDLSVFVLQSEKLSKLLQIEIQKGNMPIGSAVAEIQCNGSLLVKWTRASDLRKQELIIPVLAKD